MASVLTAADCHSAVLSGLQHVAEHGTHVPPDYSESNLGSHSYLEATDVAFDIDRPRSRIVGGAGFSLGRALLRSLWMLSGSDRVDELELLFPNIRAFTDEGNTLTGSAVGKRLFSPVSQELPLSQLDGVIARLKDHPTTRRATAVSYQALDAVRTSRDIPCLIALSWRLRDSRLECTSVMRANNVVHLLGYNLFEYTFLSECIAATLGVDIGVHHHYAVSLHAYQPDIPRLTELIEGLRIGRPSGTMPSIETSDDVFRAATSTFSCTSDFVRGVRDGRRDQAILALSEADLLPPYWREIFRVVAETCVTSARDAALTAELYGRLGPLPTWAEQYTAPTP